MTLTEFFFVFQRNLDNFHFSNLFISSLKDISFWVITSDPSHPSSPLTPLQPISYVTSIYPFYSISQGIKKDTQLSLTISKGL